MRTEDLFKYGVTPKEGENAGKRFEVVSINQKGVEVRRWGHKDDIIILYSHGLYDLWHEPKTLFEDDSIKPTWGNLKKVMEAAGLSDDTIFIKDDGFWFLQGYGTPVSFSIVDARQPYEKPKKHILAG